MSSASELLSHNGRGEGSRDSAALRYNFHQERQCLFESLVAKTNQVVAQYRVGVSIGAPCVRGPLLWPSCEALPQSCFLYRLTAIPETSK